jgi:hypothetical protein
LLVVSDTLLASCSAHEKRISISLYCIKKGGFWDFATTIHQRKTRGP